MLILDNLDNQVYEMSVEDFYKLSPEDRQALYIEGYLPDNILEYLYSFNEVEECMNIEDEYDSYD